MINETEKLKWLLNRRSYQVQKLFDSFSFQQESKKDCYYLYLPHCKIKLIRVSINE